MTRVISPHTDQMSVTPPTVVEHSELIRLIYHPLDPFAFPPEILHRLSRQAFLQRRLQRGTNQTCTRSKETEQEAMRSFCKENPNANRWLGYEGIVPDAVELG